MHRSLPGYRATPLVPLPDVARDLGVGALVVKDEESRFGLPSFKILGSSWAVHERMRRMAGRRDAPPLSLDDMRERARGTTLCCASDGNYGRSIAALAELLRCAAVVFLPSDTAGQRVSDARSHGARVVLVDGSYDETVARARTEAAAHGHWYCPDTALVDADPAELEFVRDVAAGYTTLFVELVEQLGRAPDALFVQAGVGGLASGGVVAFDALAPHARIVAVEAEGSDSLLLSLAAGEPRAVRDRFTIMAGLRCQSVSAAAWPILRERVSAAMTVADAEAADAMRVLAAHGVVAGESGAAGLAGARRALADADLRERLGIDRTTVVAVVNTEGATDRESYARIVEVKARH
ncbi:MAG TPA: diaminopropionate ammonia-lyase [Candidatus Limnocylindria bacterium]